MFSRATSIPASTSSTSRSRVSAAGPSVHTMLALLTGSTLADLVGPDRCRGPGLDGPDGGRRGATSPAPRRSSWRTTASCCCASGRRRPSGSVPRSQILSRFQSSSRCATRMPSTISATRRPNAVREVVRSRPSAPPPGAEPRRPPAATPSGTCSVVRSPPRPGGPRGTSAAASGPPRSRRPPRGPRPRPRNVPGASSSSPDSRLTVFSRSCSGARWGGAGCRPPGCAVTPHVYHRHYHRARFGR